ncbi:MAG: hypothetical protein JWO69_481 [Thermoleophilia bacterium]|jgi:hypothetical protein|nr:hypothetical protein [Thermoleophilia bacterium]
MMADDFETLLTAALPDATVAEGDDEEWLLVRGAHRISIAKFYDDGLNAGLVWHAADKPLDFTTDDDVVSLFYEDDSQGGTPTHDSSEAGDDPRHVAKLQPHVEAIYGFGAGSVLVDAEELQIEVIGDTPTQLVEYIVALIDRATPLFEAAGQVLPRKGAPVEPTVVPEGPPSMDDAYVVPEGPPAL